MHNLLKNLNQAIHYPFRFISGRMSKSSTLTKEVASGEGRVVDLGGKKVAVYKNDSNTETKLSAVCTHLGCIVDWNGEEKTWDCPCHGSRFSAEGKVIKGPAKKDLKSFDN